MPFGLCFLTPFRPDCCIAERSGCYLGETGMDFFIALQFKKAVGLMNESMRVHWERTLLKTSRDDFESRRQVRPSKVVVYPPADGRPKCRHSDVVGSFGNGGGPGRRRSPAATALPPPSPPLPPPPSFDQTPNTKPAGEWRSRRPTQPSSPLVVPSLPSSPSRPACLPASASGGFWDQIRVISRKIFCSESLKAFAAVP